VAQADFEAIKRLYYLWKPVYPHLARHIQEIYAQNKGVIMEIGPFCGSIFSLRGSIPEGTFYIAAFPEEMGVFFQNECKKMPDTKWVDVVVSDPSLKSIKDGTADLVIFRGALFFPSLFCTDFEAIFRILKPNGIGMIGGGFGKLTPVSVIETIKEESRTLNIRAGKVEIKKGVLLDTIERMRIPAGMHIVSEGGLWVIINK